MVIHKGGRTQVFANWRPLIFANNFNEEAIPVIAVNDRPARQIEHCSFSYAYSILAFSVHRKELLHSFLKLFEESEELTLAKLFNKSAQLSSPSYLAELLNENRSAIRHALKGLKK